MKGSVETARQAPVSPLVGPEHDDTSSNSSKSSMDEHTSVSSMTHVTGRPTDGTSSRSGSSSSEDSVNSCDSSDSGIAMHGSGNTSKRSSPDAEMTADENNNNNNNNNNNDTNISSVGVSTDGVTSNTNNNINNTVVYDNAGNALSITNSSTNRMLNGKSYYNNQLIVDQLAQRVSTMGIRRTDQTINFVHVGALTAVVPTTISMPSPVSPTTSMELVWHGEFDRLFSQYLPHMWYLMPTFLPPGDRFQVFKDSAKVRFSCQCGHGWTSMKGRVVFWFYLNYCANSGYVLFKLYGQKCQKCKNDRFEHSMWYPEEVIKVIGNVYNRVGQIYYGFVRPPLRIDRRQGKPRNQHQSELCLACKEGLCKEEWIS